MISSGFSVSPHLYVCPACSRTFELAPGEPIPDHSDQPGGCDYQGAATRLSFTPAEARQGVRVAILIANAPDAGPATAQPEIVHLQLVADRSTTGEEP